MSTKSKKKLSLDAHELFDPKEITKNFKNLCKASNVYTTAILWKPFEEPIEILNSFSARATLRSFFIKNARYIDGEDLKALLD